MKAIMISDHAKWCALMMNGDKTLEVRTSKALAKATQKLIDKYGFAMFYVYCTKGKQGIFKERYNGYTLLNQNKWIQSEMNGKVIFKFRCYKVEEIEPFEEYDSPMGLAYKLTEKNIITCHKAQLTYDEYNHYLKGKKGYAIHISDLEIFDEPKELWEFETTKQHLVGVIGQPQPIIQNIRLTKAPQNFCYVEVE